MLSHQNPTQSAKLEPVDYPEEIRLALSRICALLVGEYGISKEMIALLLLQRDSDITHRVHRAEPGAAAEIDAIVEHAVKAFTLPLSVVISRPRLSHVHEVAESVVTRNEQKGRSFRETLSRLMMSPLTGIPLLALVLYFGFYKFVGVFGAGTLVDFIEGTVFGEYINPWLAAMSERYIPWQVLRDLFTGEYGIFTLGLSYALAIVLPIVTLFFIMFSIIEDSGYLPRLAMLIDRAFKGIGLNGRAVIPLVLGFGCDTMATIVTRTQETRRERLLTTILLALAIPCSAQLGVVMGILSSSPLALLIWAGSLMAVFLLVGYAGARILPGKAPGFYMELPPLRMPIIKNVLLKTLARLRWYLVEVIPIFILTSIALWLGDLTGVFDLIIAYVMKPLVTFIGLPDETSVAFFFGFFRRDFGAAGLYDLHSSGVLTGIPLVVAAVTLTLFLPCIAQFSIMLRERGWKATLAVSAFILPFAFGFGYLLNFVLTTLKVPV